MYSYRQQVLVITLFPNIFSYFFSMLSEFAKVWRVQVTICIMQPVHFLVPLGVSNCQQILTMISFVIFDIECRLAWHSSTDLGLIEMLLLVYYYSENRATSRIWKVLPNMVFPQFERKNGGVLSMRMQVILDSLFARPGSAPIWGGKKGEFRDWTTSNNESKTAKQRN